MGFTAEQLRHDSINLRRIAKTLESSALNENWEVVEGSDASDEKWLKAQANLQGIKHCRVLLRNLEQFNENVAGSSRSNLRNSDSQALQRLRQRLDDMEIRMVAVSETLQPRPRQRQPLLPKLPVPTIKKPESRHTASEKSGSWLQESSLLSAEEGDAQTSTIVHDLLGPPEPSVDLSSPPALNPSTTLIPPSFPSTSISTPATATKSTITTNQTLQTSTALQTELSDQLARMATQLKLNAMHFADALANDQNVVKEAQEKLEGTHDNMTQRRVKLRDHTSKSWGTTGLVFTSIIIVAISFVLMIFILRLT